MVLRKFTSKNFGGGGGDRKDFQVSSIFYSTRKSNILRKKNFSKKLHTQKMDRVARRGPLARAPGALKEGHFRNCQHFCRS